jgi:hypothetical protein
VTNPLEELFAPTGKTREGAVQLIHAFGRDYPLTGLRVAGHVLDGVIEAVQDNGPPHVAQLVNALVLSLHEIEIMQREHEIIT